MSQEDWFKLIHPRIGEEKSRIGQGDDGGGGHEAVAMLFYEIVDKRLTNPVHRPVFSRERGGGGGRGGRGERGGRHAEKQGRAEGGAAVWRVPVAGWTIEDKNMHIL